MTLRIEDVQARELELAARADRIPVSSFIREAIESAILPGMCGVASVGLIFWFAVYSASS
jgi:hypothetical protein